MSLDDIAASMSLDELFGTGDDAEPHRRALTLVRGDAVEELPSAEELSHDQFVDAVERIHENATHYPQFPWTRLAQLSGPLCPEDLIMIAARTGGGKSLFLQNLFDALVCSGVKALYIGLEQAAKILRVKWACLRADVPPRLMLAPRQEEYRTELWYAAADRVQKELQWQRSDEIKPLAHFAAARKINRTGLLRWTEWAVDLGCRVVIVDHVDRVDHGDGRNSFHEVSETVRLAKELAAKHRIVMIMASQVGRPGDAVESLMPPALHNLRGAGTKEEESDTVIGIYRPVKPGVTDKEIKRVRQGQQDRDTIIEPNVMGVMLLKHRLDGPAAGKVIKLGVRHQKVFDLPERDQYSTDRGQLRNL